MIFNFNNEMILYKNNGSTDKFRYKNIIRKQLFLGGRTLPGVLIAAVVASRFSRWPTISQ